MLQYALAIFLGAFLLFQVQPLIGKFILPWFGGGPAVWTACMLFFQVLLLAGYAYAHFLRTHLAQRRQAVIHIALLVAAIAMLPIVPSPRLKPQGAGDPTWGILLLLASTVGLPYLMLATNSPLLQAWFSASSPSRSPYRLYALSNLGSLLALITYPVLIEPAFALRTQAAIWSLGFGLFAAVASVCALRTPEAAAAPPPSPPEPGAAEPAAEAAARPPSLSARLLWIALTSCGSLLLLAVTSQMCADVAIVPFLWVLPLVVYLLSFILCFHSARWYPRVAWWVLAFVALGGGELVRRALRLPFSLAFRIFGTPSEPDPEAASAIGLFAWRFVTGSGFLGADIEAHEPVCLALGGIPWLLNEGVSVSILGQIVGLTAALFICCMVCHGELVRLKPDPRHLTSFYLYSSVGGALGGVFATIVAPRLFPAYLELHIGLWLCCALAMAAYWADRMPHRQWRTKWRVFFYLPAFVGLLVVLGIALKRDADETLKGSLSLTRSFYGVLRVSEYYRTDPERHYYSLQHGRISHGNQFAAEHKRRWPTSYYGEESGVGLALRHLPRPPGDGLRFGVVGLGTGTLAAYAGHGDYCRFYEINPAVERLAETWFHYLADSRSEGADVQVVLGDARLSLERQEPQRFDVLALDAFTSDAIPIHLLTREAFEVYRRHLKPTGVLAVHISNRYLDLEPVVLAQADHFGYKAVIVESKSDKERRVDSATWVLVTRNEDFLAAEPIREIIEENRQKAEEDEGVRRLLTRRVPWTDDYSDLFRVLK